MGCGTLKRGSDSKHSNHIATEAAAAAVVVVRVIGRSGLVAAGALRVCLCPSCNHIATGRRWRFALWTWEGNCHLDFGHHAISTSKVASF